MRSVRRGLGFGLASVTALGVLACRSPVVREAGVYRHRDLGYSIAAPPGPEGFWVSSSVAGTDLGFRSREGDTLTVATRCGKPTASPRVLARHLRFALGDHALRREGSVVVEGAPGWMQVLDVHAASASVRVKTVTVVLEECIFDFLLAARRHFEEAERSFDAWLETFRLGNGQALGGRP